MRILFPKVVAVFAVVASFGSTATPQAATPDSSWTLSEYRTVSLVGLLANPERFHGRRITIVGYLHWRSEDASVYLSKLDADYLNSANAVWIHLADNVRKRPLTPYGNADAGHSMAYFDSKYVSVTGVFNKDKRGHLGGFSGTLDSVYVVSEIRRTYNGKEKLK